MYDAPTWAIAHPGVPFLEAFAEDLPRTTKYDNPTQPQLQHRRHRPRLDDAERDRHVPRGRMTTNDRSPRFHTRTWVAVATSGNHGSRCAVSAASASSGTIRSSST